MDISSYWQSIKKQSKELTGVEKINSGIFHASGIGSSLEKYIKSVNKGDEKKIAKDAKSALDKAEKYLNTIHKKEVVKGKKAMTKAQLKSAGIVTDALEKIVAQLKDVVSGNADAGSFDRDSDGDVYNVTMKAAEAHITLRKKVAVDAKGYIDLYRKQSAPVAKLIKLAEKAVRDAKTSQSKGQTQQNLMAMDTAERVVQEIEKIVAKIETHYKKYMLNGKSDFMVGRQDFSMGSVPKKYLADYKKRHNAAWKPVAQLGNAINEVRNGVTGDLETARQIRDEVESYSLRGVDPEKQVAKIEDIGKQAAKLEGAAGNAAQRIEGGIRMMADAVKPEIPAENLKKAIDLRGPEAQKRVAQVMEAVKSARKLQSRLEALTRNTETKTVLDAGMKAMQPIARLEDLAKKVAANYKTLNDAMAKAKQIYAERAKGETVG